MSSEHLPLNVSMNVKKGPVGSLIHDVETNSTGLVMKVVLNITHLSSLRLAKFPLNVDLTGHSFIELRAASFD